MSSLPIGLSLTTLALQAGRVGPSFVVVLGAVTKRTAPRGAHVHHHWFLAGSLASEGCSGQAETAMLEWEPRGLARKLPSQAAGCWPLEGRGAGVCICVVSVYVQVCVCVYRESSVRQHLEPWETMAVRTLKILETLSLPHTSYCY